MAEAAEDRVRHDAAIAMHVPRTFGCFELEHAMRSRRVVVLDVVRPQDSVTSP
jgi:hypothetical protein